MLSTVERCAANWTVWTGASAPSRAADSTERRVGELGPATRANTGNIKVTRLYFVYCFVNFKSLIPPIYLKLSSFPQMLFLCKSWTRAESCAQHRLDCISSDFSQFGQ